MIERIEWDSAVFQQDRGRITDITGFVLSADARSALGKWDHVVAVLPGGAWPLVRRLGTLDFVPVAARVDLAVDIAPGSPPVSTITRETHDGVDGWLPEAQGLFGRSRFHADPWTTYEEAEHLHSAWLRALASRGELYVLKSPSGLTTYGFVGVEVDRDHKTARLSLVGRLPSGPRGVGQALVEFAKVVASVAGCTILVTRTQADNCQALRLYAAADFWIDGADIVMAWGHDRTGRPHG